ncbi:MAG: hypothetical protein OEX76_06985 [Candidatus Bathyarchaeota archaeon]|nr:hypothetical protein [Candidatus Bathyarchaeota archaeon]MDH5713497.1 hypothetical protein [Candidatus Bathyarchaeota archaeon]
MGDTVHHARLAKEKREAALDEFSKGRYTVVGDLALKAVEQAIEAVVAKSGMHFHLNPRTAHAERVKWVKKNLSEVAADLDLIWGAYGDLGCNGLDGKRAREAVEAMERVVDGIGKWGHIRFR